MTNLPLANIALIYANISLFNDKARPCISRPVKGRIRSTQQLGCKRSRKTLKYTLTEILVSVLAFLGVAMLFNVRADYQIGIIYALVSSFLSALFTVLGGVLMRAPEGATEAPAKASLITAYQMLGGTLTLAAYLAFQPDLWATASLDSTNLGLGLILGIVCTAIPLTASLDIMRTLKPFTVCLTVNLEPVYAIILALIHFGESEIMSAHFYLASLVVLSSVMMNGYLQSSQQS